MARGYPAPHVDSRNTSPRSVCDCCPLAMQTFQFVLNIVAPFLWIFLLIFDFHSSMIYQRLMLPHFPFSLLHRMTLVSPCAETFCGFCHIVGNKTRGVLSDAIDTCRYRNVHQTFSPSERKQIGNIRSKTSQRKNWGLKPENRYVVVAPTRKRSAMSVLCSKVNLTRNV